ncbi:MAG: ABC transporter ATP-binding protein, partial [Xanthobacteraceae bacterium]
VTHDVDEAVFLADRVAMLTSRPSTIGFIVETRLERPRDAITTREDQRFLTMRHRLVEILLKRPAVEVGHG